MTVQVELPLRSGNNGVRMSAEPVAELASLRGDPEKKTNQELQGESYQAKLTGELFDVELSILPGTAKEILFRLRH